MNENELIQRLQSLRGHPMAQPDAAFAKNARIRILNRIRVSRTPQQSPSWVRRLWQIALAALAAPALLGVGVVAAQGSNPHDVLYPIKIASEKVALTLSPDPKTKTNVATTIIDRRAQEITAATASADRTELDDRIHIYKETIRSIQQTKNISEDEIKSHVEEHAPIIQRIEEHDTEDTHETPTKSTEKSSDE